MADVKCDDQCGCSLPCPGGETCKCTTSGGVTTAGADVRHATCSCGAHCSCTPCTLCGTATATAVRCGSCTCGAACACPVCPT